MGKAGSHWAGREQEHPERNPERNPEPPVRPRPLAAHWLRAPRASSSLWLAPVPGQTSVRPSIHPL